MSRVLLCSGKIYYDLLAAREERKAQHVAIVRFEQLYPFPAQDLEEILAKYERADEVVWVQEEPRNMGPWRYMRERLQPPLEASDRSTPLRRPAGKRQPGDGLPQAPPRGAGCGHRGRLRTGGLAQPARGPPGP